MYRLFVLIALVSFCIACEKEVVLAKKTATELLTQEEWILASYGYDDNKNGYIDPSEEIIRDCEMDNSYLFREDGTGNVYDNQVSCGNGLSDQYFNWQFMNGETGLDFVFGIAKILLLNEDELIIYQGTNNTTNFIVRFRH